MKLGTGLCLMLALFLLVNAPANAGEVNGIKLPDGLVTSDEDPDSAKWVKTYTQLMNRGDSWGTFKLAEWTFYGHGVVKKDVPKAIDLFERAVEGKPKAPDWFNRGAYSAAHFLAVAYDNGEGVPEDDERSVQWFIKAATLDLPKSLEMLKEYATEGSGAANTAIGFVYLFGNGVKEDTTESAKWFIRAAEYEHPIGQVLAGIHLISGDGVEADTVKAAQYIASSAKHGYANGEEKLGELYLEGTGVPTDHTEAAQWLLRAADKGRPNAQFLIAKLYSQGLGIGRDQVAAYVWCNLSAAQGHKDAKELLPTIQGGLSPQQLMAAQERSRAWWKKHQQME